MRGNLPSRRDRAGGGGPGFSPRRLILAMPADANATRLPEEAAVQEFARAFRSAARAVSFYPSSHQAVASALERVVAAARAATADGSLCLTILPKTLLARGVPIDTSQSAVVDVANLCHRHGVGALNLDGRDTPDAWRALLTLLAQKPEDARGAGGIQRQWKALRHLSPTILEIDFGALLRGQVGGDFIELAGVISHYLETAGVGGSILDDPCGALRRAIENAPDDARAVEAVVRELRAAAQLTWTQPDQFDDVFRRAATVGEFLGEGVLNGLLDRRGTEEAMVGQVDVVSALVERMSNSTVSKLLSKIMGEADAASAGPADLFKRLVSDGDRRRAIVQGAHEVTLADNVAGQWADLERNLEAYSDPQFVSDEYLNELHSVQVRADQVRRDAALPPELRAAWVQSIDDGAVRELDAQLLGDLARLETEYGRSRKVLEILQAHAFGAADEDDWAGVAHAVALIAGVASESADDMLRQCAVEILQNLSKAPLSTRALAMLADAEPPLCDTLSRALSGIGAPLLPAIAARWAAESGPALRARLEPVVVAIGRPGRESLRRLLASADEPADVRAAAIRLLQLTAGSEHLPALETALSDPREDIRREAFAALADSSSARGPDILARGIARADAATQAVLLAWLLALGDRRAWPVLQRLFSQVDPRSVSVPVYLSMIAAVGRTGREDAAPLLTAVCHRTHLSAPIRTWRFRAAAKSALRVLGRHAAAVPRKTLPVAQKAPKPAAAAEERRR
jgi:hypothetical protein